MRLIDADAFKAYIRSALEDTKHLYKDNAAWAKEITESFCKDIDEQPTIEAEPRWIPCSERLPEDVQIGDEYPIVIFCTKEKTYTGFYEYYRGGRWWTADSDSVVDGVIAWMPLPEPYTEPYKGSEE